MSDRFTSPGWGVWAVDLGQSTFTQLSERYNIAFDRLLTPADLIFWIFQLNGKGWGAKSLPGFINALDDALDPQSNPTFTAESIRVQVRAFLADPHVPVEHLP